MKYLLSILFGAAIIMPIAGVFAIDDEEKAPELPIAYSTNFETVSPIGSSWIPAGN